MPSKLVSAVIAGLAGGLLIGCSFLALIFIAGFPGFLSGGSREASPTITPIGDSNLGIAVMVFLLWILVLMPVFIAVAGALSVKLSRRHIRDAKSCILTSYVAGVISVGLGVLLYYFIKAYSTGPSFEDVSLGSRAGLFTGQAINWFTNPGAIVIMLLFALLSIIGGIVYYWLSKKKHAATL